MKNVELSKTFSQKGVAWITVGVFPALMVPTMMCMLIYAQIDFKHLKSWEIPLFHHAKH